MGTRVVVVALAGAILSAAGCMRAGWNSQQAGDAESGDGVTPSVDALLDRGGQEGPADGQTPVGDATTYSFSQDPSPTTETLNSVWGPGGATGPVYIVGNAGTILQHLSSSGWTKIDSGTTKNLHAIWGSGQSDLYVGGDSGTMLRFDGSGFKAMPPAGTSPVSGLWGTPGGSSLIAVSSKSGTVQHFDGKAWSAKPSTSAPLHAVWGTGPDNVFAVGGAGSQSPSRVVRFDGATWKQMTVPGVTRVLYGVWGTGPDHVLAVGEIATVMRYDGADWSFSFADKAYTLQGVWGSGPNNVWVVGGGGMIQRFDGEDWTIVASNVPVGLRGIWGSSPTDIVVVGNQGTILRLAP